MRVIICGAGRVGFYIAQYLASEEIDVAVVDQSHELITPMINQLDIQAVVGHAADPSILEQAGAADAEMLIAVTKSDEVNLVSCQIAAHHFDVTTTIARVRTDRYADPTWTASLFNRTILAVDILISPEREVAEAIARRVNAPGVFNLIPLVAGCLVAAAVRCHEECPLVNTPLRQLTSVFPDLRMRIVGIHRKSGAVIIPNPETEMDVGDLVYFICDEAMLSRSLTAFGINEQPDRRLLVAGAGQIGSQLVELLLGNDRTDRVYVLEANLERARTIASNHPKAHVIEGSVLDPHDLAQADITGVDAVITVTESDQTNLIGALLAKSRNSNARQVCLINDPHLARLALNLGVQVVINPHEVTASKILHVVRRGRVRAAHSVLEGRAELLDVELLENSAVVGSAMSELKFPIGAALVGAILRGGEKALFPRGETVLAVGDRVFVLALNTAIKQIERQFASQL